MTCSYNLGHGACSMDIIMFVFHMFRLFQINSGGSLYVLLTSVH